MNCTHYIFDFDGTLVDSMPYWAETMLSILDKHGVSYPDNIIGIITPLGIDATCDYFISIGLRDSHENIHDEIYDSLTVKYKNIIPAKAGVRQGLLSLKARGKHLHVLTASPHIWLDVCLKRNGLFDFFENVWSAEDFGTTKTNPDIYGMAARRIGTTTEDVVFLDDNINAVKAGAEGGVKTIGVYDASSPDGETEFRAICDGYIKTFDEL